MRGSRHAGAGHAGSDVLRGPAVGARREGKRANAAVADFGQRHGGQLGVGEGTGDACVGGTDRQRVTGQPRRTGAAQPTGVVGRCAGGEGFGEHDHIAGPHGLRCAGVGFTGRIGDRCQRRQTSGRHVDRIVDLRAGPGLVQGQQCSLAGVGVAARNARVGRADRQRITGQPRRTGAAQHTGVVGRYAGGEGFGEHDHIAGPHGLRCAGVGFTGRVGDRCQRRQASGRHVDRIVNRRVGPGLVKGQQCGLAGVGVGARNARVGRADGQGAARQAARAGAPQGGGVVGRVAGAEGFRQRTGLAGKDGGRGAGGARRCGGQARAGVVGKACATDRDLITGQRTAPGLGQRQRGAAPVVGVGADHVATGARHGHGVGHLAVGAAGRGAAGAAQRGGVVGQRARAHGLGGQRNDVAGKDGDGRAAGGRRRRGGSKGHGVGRAARGRAEVGDVTGGRVGPVLGQLQGRAVARVGVSTHDGVAGIGRRGGQGVGGLAVTARKGAPTGARHRGGVVGQQAGGHGLGRQPDRLRAAERHRRAVGSGGSGGRERRRVARQTGGRAQAGHIAGIAVDPEFFDLQRGRGHVGDCKPGTRKLISGGILSPGSSPTSVSWCPTLKERTTVTTIPILLRTPNQIDDEGRSTARSTETQ